MFRRQLKKELDGIENTKERYLGAAFGGALIFFLMALSEFLSPHNACIKPGSFLCLVAGVVSKITGFPLEESNWQFYVFVAILCFVAGVKFIYKKPWKV